MAFAADNGVVACRALGMRKAPRTAALRAAPGIDTNG